MPDDEGTAEGGGGDIAASLEAQVPLLELRGISKRFGAVQALTDVDFEIYPAEVVALVGDNGAGKSTLIKCIAGVHQPDEGEIYIEGREVKIQTPSEATRLGIETVYQDLALCDNLDVVANMFLGREASRAGRDRPARGDRDGEGRARGAPRPERDDDRQRARRRSPRSRAASASRSRSPGP